jgi:hypothetical protein
MLFAPPLFRHGPVTAEFRQGQVEDTHERDLPIAEDQTAGGTTLSVDDVLSGFVKVSGNGGAVATTLPTADQICAALRASFGLDVPPANAPYGPNVAPDKEFPSNLGIIPPGSSFRFVLQNTNVGTSTLTTSAGNTLVGTATVLAASWREWLVRIKNSTPATLGQASTTNTSKVLSNVSIDTLNKVTPGMLATGTGLGAAPNRVMAVNRDAKTITLDVAATATADNIAVTFTPEISWTALRGGSN